MTPKDFINIYPWDSVLQNCECEIVLLNILKILNKYHQNQFKIISFDEYLYAIKKNDIERNIKKQDWEYNAHKKYFDLVNHYSSNEQTLKSFSSAWRG